MRIPTIWVKHTEELTVDNWEKFGDEWVLNGTLPKEYVFIGGSNSTEEAAFEQALKKRDIVKAKIEGHFNSSSNLEYEIDICEEIIGKIDDQNIITRNKYGALVLNSAHIMIIDIDNPKFKRLSEINTLLELVIHIIKKIVLFRSGILGIIGRKLSRNKFEHLYSRIYETPNGYRLIILGEDFDAKSIKSEKIMKSLRADRSYTNLCNLQNCYRARLTPKPWRIGVKRPKIIFPFRTEEEEKVHQAWVNNYQTVSEGFAACRLVKEIGKPIQNRVVEYHDKFCKALSGLPMG